MIGQKEHKNICQRWSKTSYTSNVKLNLRIHITNKMMLPSNAFIIKLPRIIEAQKTHFLNRKYNYLQKKSVGFFLFLLEDTPEEENESD